MHSTYIGFYVFEERRPNSGANIFSASVLTTGVISPTWYPDFEIEETRTQSFPKVTYTVKSITKMEEMTSLRF